MNKHHQPEIQKSNSNFLSIIKITLVGSKTKFSDYN